MRRVATTSDHTRAQALSTLLTAHGIENRLELSLDKDWGSETYGTVHCTIWVFDEDKLAAAQHWVEKWQQHESLSLPTTTLQQQQEHAMSSQTPPPSPPPRTIGFLTVYLLTFCIALFVMTSINQPTVSPPLPNLPLMPLFSSPVKKTLLYDYPHTFELVDELAATYSMEQLRDPITLPPAGQELFITIHHTPWWQGFYPILIDVFSGKDTSEAYHVPWMEKIRQGELWRLISPILLHGDIFHLLFNMLWLISLGRQLEQSLGVSRYILFIVIVAIISNTAQYLMSGPNFIGLSGVLCGMLAFIWQRQHHAPWEGYQLDNATIRMLFLFIGAMAGLQLFSFITEISSGHDFSPGLANTAHLVGAITGYYLGRLPYFSLRFYKS
jgi:GlpG protein